MDMKMKTCKTCGQEIGDSETEKDVLEATVRGYATGAKDQALLHLLDGLKKADDKEDMKEKE